MGSLAAAGAAAIGTGAFTSVEAERTVSVNIVSDANAYLKLASDGDYVSNDNSAEFTIDLGSVGNGAGGRGFNRNAASAVDEVFEIHNQGTKTVDISLEYSGDGKVVQEVDNANLDWNEGVYFEVSDDVGGSSIGSGRSTTVDVAVVEQGGDGVSGGTLTIHADEA
jgi:hypothetical protein